MVLADHAMLLPDIDKEPKAKIRLMSTPSRTG